MRAAFPLFVLCLALLTTRVEAGDTPKPKASQKKSNFNTQIYEKEEESTSFSDTVSVLREVAGQQQVFFVEKKGVFYVDADLNSGKAVSLLAMSQKKKVSLSITADMTTRQILNVSQGSGE